MMNFWDAQEKFFPPEPTKPDDSDKIFTVDKGEEKEDNKDVNNNNSSLIEENHSLKQQIEELKKQIDSNKEEGEKEDES